MMPGGCDTTQDMIDDWVRSTQELVESKNNQDVGPDTGELRGPIGEDSTEPGTTWMPHRLHKGSDMLHVKGMFGAVRPIMYRSRLEAERIAKKVGGVISYTKDAKYHVLRHRTLKEDLDGTGGTEAAGTQTYGESDPKKTVSTIKRIVRTKYKRRLI